MTILYNEED